MRGLPRWTVVVMISFTISADEKKRMRCFYDWVRSYKGKLPMSREQLEKYLKDRNF